MPAKPASEAALLFTVSLASAALLDHPVADGVENIGVVAGAARQQVVAEAAVQDVVAGIAEDRVVAGIAGAH